MHRLLVPVGVAAVVIADDQVGEVDTRVNCGVEAAFLVSAELLGVPLEFRPSFHDVAENLPFVEDLPYAEGGRCPPWCCVALPYEDRPSSVDRPFLHVAYGVVQSDERGDPKFE